MNLVRLNRCYSCFLVLLDTCLINGDSIRASPYIPLIKSSVQVPLLLSIGEEDVALMKATECGDTDLVYLVVFHIWQKVLGSGKLHFKHFQVSEVNGVT